MRFAYECPLCGRRLQAETRTVLDMLKSTHLRACAEKSRRAIELARRDAAQGKLFG